MEQGISGFIFSVIHIMLTKYVYHIQLKKQKKLPAIWGVFSATFILLKDLKVTAY